MVIYQPAVELLGVSTEPAADIALTYNPVTHRLEAADAAARPLHSLESYPILEESMETELRQRQVASVEDLLLAIVDNK